MEKEWVEANTKPSNSHSGSRTVVGVATDSTAPVPKRRREVVSASSGSDGRRRMRQRATPSDASEAAPALAPAVVAESLPWQVLVLELIRRLQNATGGSFNPTTSVAETEPRDPIALLEEAHALLGAAFGSGALKFRSHWRCSVSVPPVAPAKAPLPVAMPTPSSTVPVRPSAQPEVDYALLQSPQPASPQELSRQVADDLLPLPAPDTPEEAAPPPAPASPSPSEGGSQLARSCRTPTHATKMAEAAQNSERVRELEAALEHARQELAQLKEEANAATGSAPGCQMLLAFEAELAEVQRERLELREEFAVVEELRKANANLSMQGTGSRGEPMHQPLRPDAGGCSGGPATLASVGCSSAHAAVADFEEEDEEQPNPPSELQPCSRTYRHLEGFSDWTADGETQATRGRGAAAAAAAAAATGEHAQRDRLEVAAAAKDEEAARLRSELRAAEDAARGRREPATGPHAERAGPAEDGPWLRPAQALRQGRARGVRGGGGSSGEGSPGPARRGRVPAAQRASAEVAQRDADGCRQQ